ncbi:MAG: ABC transporter ATP-binding protein [bacterium]
MFGFIKELWWFIKRNVHYYLGIIFFGIIQAILILKPADFIADFCNQLDLGLDNDYLIFNLVLPFLLVTIGIYAATVAKRIIQMRLGIKLNTKLRIRYMEKILASDAVFFEDFQSGDLLTRALGDVASVRQSGSFRIVNIFLEFVTIIITFTAMISMNVMLTLASCAILPFIFFANFLLKKIVKRNWKNVREASSDLGNDLLETITNIKTVKAFSKEQEVYEKVKAKSDNLYKIEFKYNRVNALFYPMFQSVVALSIGIAYYFGSKYIYNSDPEFDLLKFALYLNLLSWPLMRLGNIINFFYESLISLTRLQEIYDYDNNYIDKEDAKSLKSIDSIKFNHFTFKYPHDNIDTICNLDFEIKRGQTVGVVGKTGSGKSTLIRQLLKQFFVDDSSVLVNGISINEYTKSSIRSHISYVPQEHTLFSRSIIENILLGSLEHKTQEEVDEAILLADFKKDIQYLAEGLKTKVGEYGVTLSGGQKQRLSIARAFIKNSEILILDDSLSAVDGKTEKTIISNLQKFRATKTNIIIAHRLSAVKSADNIIVIDNGKIVESGTHDELINLGGWYFKQYVEQQIVGDDHE